MKEDNRND